MVWQVYAIFFAVLLFAATGAAAVIHAAKAQIRRRRGGGDGDEPKCGRCGYIIHRGARRVCPECGADLSVTGVTTGSTVRPAFPFLTLWLVSVMSVVLGFFAGPWLARQTPWGWRFYAWCMLHTTERDETTNEGTSRAQRGVMHSPNEPAAMGAGTLAWMVSAGMALWVLSRWHRRRSERAARASRYLLDSLALTE